MSHNSTAKIDQKEYLKKYLSGEKTKKKKKKKDKDKDKEKKRKHFRIIDDDASAFQNNGNSDDEIHLYDEDAPQVVGEYIETKPNGDSGKWRKIALRDEKHYIKVENDDDRSGKNTSVKVKDENAMKIKREITPDASPRRRNKKSKSSMDRKRKSDALDQSAPRQRRQKLQQSDGPPGDRNNHESPHQRRESSIELSLSPSPSGDLSPPRIHKNTISPQRRHASPNRRHQLTNDPVRPQRRMSADFSPPRRRRNSIDQSPPRQRNNRKEQFSQQGKFSRDSSPPRKHKSSISPRRGNDFIDQAPPRRGRDSLDQSPPRRHAASPRPQKNRFSSNSSPTRKGWHGSDDLPSTPGRGNNVATRFQKDTRRNSPLLSPSRRRRSSTTPNRQRRDFRDSSSKRRVLSPQYQTDFSRTERQNRSSFERARNNNAWNSAAPRHVNPFADRKNAQHNQSYSPEKRNTNFVRRRDEFPRRQTPSRERNRRNEGFFKNDNFVGNRNMSFQSPSRRRQFSPRQDKRRVTPPYGHNDRRSHSAEHSPAPPPKTIHWETAAMVAQRKARRSASSPPPSHKPKTTKTLDGKKAGLQDARALKEETAARRRDEDKMFAKMSNEISGRDAEVQVRSTVRLGRRARDAKAEDPEKQRQKEERDQKRKEQYDRWGKGLKQIEDHRARLADQEYESSKPLARYADDEDLDRHLREQERSDDPMLEYMRRKKKETEKKTGSKHKVPVYEGSYPENRFGIRPGHRWDGVDRSNGYEKKWFDVQNEKRAVQEDAYKYSVEDM